MSSSASSTSSSSPEPQSKRKKDDSTSESEDEESSSSSESESEAENRVDDTSALSHAEKRRQKKKEKLALLKGKGKESPPKKKRKLADGTSTIDSNRDITAPSKRQNSVWVGNLSFKTTPEALRKFFDGVGEITRIHMPTKPATRPGTRGENRGFAYVDFSTPDAKTIAITLSENPLNGRKLLIKDGGDYTGRPATTSTEGVTIPSTSATRSKTAQKILRAQKQPPAPTLFLGNLGFETTEDSIRELLEAHRGGAKKAKKDSEDREEQVTGKKDETDSEPWIRRIRMGTFEDTGNCKGFAFVDFSSIENATSVLINPKNHHLNGRNLVVEYASPDAVRRGPNKPKPAEGEASSGDLKNKRSNGAQGDRPPRKTKANANAEFRSHSRHNDGGDDNEGEAAEAKAGDERDASQHWDADDSKRTRRPNRDVGSKGGEGASRQKGPRNRPKPGAALALAKRQSAAIVINAPSKKIVF